MNSLRKIKQGIFKSATNSRPLQGLSENLGIVLTPEVEDESISLKIESAILEFLKENCGITLPSDAKLEHLHDFLNPDRVGECMEFVNSSLRKELYLWATNICKKRLLFDNVFYIDKQIFIRINLPFDCASKGKSSYITDPLHRLTQYNKGRPRSAWGHGPHKDSWYGHSHSSINLWLAVTNTNYQNTMTLYPEHAYRSTSFDPATMYASHNVKLNKYLKVQLNRGENFIFDPELLHATRINSSKYTRVAITLRVSPIEPVFSLNVNHDIYDEWISSDNIEQGRLIPIRVHNRIEIEDYPETLPSNEINQINLASLTFNDLKNLHSVERKNFEIEDGEIFQLLLKDGQYLGVWLNSEMFIFPAHCPHIGAPLAMGAINIAEKTIKCPGHGLEFSLQNGASSCMNLKIKTQSIKASDKSSA